jgi:hypothetical protein
MRDINHMVRVDSAKRSKAITDNGEEGDQNIIDDVDNIFLLRTQRNPANEEKDPSRSE